MVESWALDLFAGAALPDKRLNPRAVQIASVMALNPADAIPQAFGRWADVKGAYRFVENDRVKPGHIHNAHRGKTARDVRGCAAVVVIQDSTTLSFPRAPATEGLGLISSSDTPGLMVHSALVVGLDGLPVGLAWQEVWAREGKRSGSKEKRRALPIEEKESFKWLRAMAETRRTLGEIAADERPRPIHVCDRESDIHEVFENVIAHGEGAVIRAMHDRRVSDEDGGVGSGWDQVAGAPVLSTMEVEVRRRGDRPARTATVELRSVAIELRPATSREPDRRPVRLNLVEAREIGAGPDVKEPVLWRLLTTEPAKSFDEAREVVRLYALRWTIEEFHFTLKSGCRIEDVRFHTAERIEIVLAFYGPVAVLLMQLRHFSRAEPDAPCTRVLDETAWRALYAAIHHHRPPQDTVPPTMRQAVLWIGRLGGHLGRKGDGMPGLRTLWRGWRDLWGYIAFARALHLL